MPVLFKHETESAKRMKHEQKKEHSIYRRQHIFFCSIGEIKHGKKKMLFKKVKEKSRLLFFCVLKTKYTADK